MWNGENSDITTNTLKNYMYKDNIYIFDQMTSENCAYLIGDLSTYVFNEENKNKNKIVRIFINSPGGETDIAFNFLSLMNIGRINGIIFHTIVLGHAGSAASLIACSGDLRIMGESATNFIHFGYYSCEVAKEIEIEKINKNITRWHNKIKELYLRFSNGKLPEKDLNRFMGDEQTVLTADECLKYSLADSVVEYELATIESENQKQMEDFKEFKNWCKNQKNSSKKKIKRSK